MNAALFLAVLTVASVANGQGTFRNMDFEQSQIPQNQPSGLVAADLAFPSWTVYYGSTPQTQVLWNDVSVGSTLASLVGQRSGALDGGYSAFLFGGSSGPSTPVDCSISQVGQLPDDAVSLLFEAHGVQQLTVAVSGVTLPLFDVSSGPNYEVYGVNVSQFAGMQEDLRFTAPGFTPNGPNIWTIDNIVFSTTPVPEPSTAVLVALAGLALLNKSLMTNRRSPLPLGAKRKLGRATHAPSLPSAAVAYLNRSVSK